MVKEYSTKIDVTMLAKDYVNYFYRNLTNFIMKENDEFCDWINTFPELKYDILDETMRLITVDYCKKKSAENESKKGE